MARLTLKQAARKGVFVPDYKALGLRFAVLAEALGDARVWVSDERKLSGDDDAVFLVVEVGDDIETADWLRAFGPPIVPLQNGWWTRAVSPDYRVERSFRLDAFVFEPVRYTRNGRTTRAAVLHGFRLADGRYHVHFELDTKGNAVPPRGWAGYFAAYVRQGYALGKDKLAADFHLVFDPATLAVAPSDITEYTQRGVEQWFSLAAMMTLDAYRRASRWPRGEGPQAK